MILGCMLIMCWFSLAMSPLATEWFQQIEWQSTRDFPDDPLTTHRPHGTVMTKDGPMAFWLILWPAATLATAGLLFGTACGVYGYVRHRRLGRGR
jgi:hypothetical protein